MASKTIKIVKTVLVGDGNCGKTSAAVSYTTNRFPEHYTPTVFDNYSSNVMVNNEAVLLQIWDTAGPQKHEKLRPLSYTQTDGFLMFYSISCRSSFHNIKLVWEPEIRHHCPTTPIILVATKLDLRFDLKLAEQLNDANQTMVTTEEGQKMAQSIGASSFHECSALTQEGLADIFDSLLTTVIQARNKNTAKSNCACVIL